LTPPDVETAAQLYELTQEVCAAAGFEAYEISNHARSAEARSRHNQVYWRADDWIGVGPGAHGRITHNGARIATEAHRRPADYIDAVRENGLGWLTESELTGEEAADEALLMGLRIDDGVDAERVASLRGRPLNPRALDWLAGEGFITFADGRVKLTPRGRIVANSVAAELAV